MAGQRQGQGQQVIDQNGNVVLMHPQAGVGMVDPKALAIAGGLSDAMSLAVAIDGIARRIPWYVWLGLGIYGTYWWQKRGRSA